MKRLTAGEMEEITTEPYGCVFYCNRTCNLDGDWCVEGPGCPKEVDPGTAMHLLELAQAEKDGRLVVLPCNIHQPLYILKNGEIHRNYGCQWHFTDKECQTFGTLSMYGEFVKLDDFGKTVFLTREEAEAVLKKREEADNEAD